MFHIDYASIFQNFSPELATVLIAMLPIAELRAAIPVAIVGFEMSWWSAYIWAVIGNIIPAFFLVWLLDPVSKWLMKHSKIFNKFFNWVFDRTRKKFTTRAKRYGSFIALVLFVAIPLPITGAWTGSVAAFLFGISFKKSMTAITTGVLIAGLIVSIMTIGAVTIF
ncbi:MAG: COG2426 family protein [Candidatus Kerfeldbacteria bacterium]